MAQSNPFLRSPYDAIGRDAVPLPGQQATTPDPEAPDLSAAPVAAPVPAAPSTPATPAPRAPVAEGDLLPPQALRPIFEASAREFNVPVNVLMALGQQESRYKADAIGQPTKYGRAKGMMQYLDDTAQRLGINAFDPNEVIPAAARQLRERLDKGESMIDAVRGHFAGPDRAQWGPNTAAYGEEVLAKAGQIGEALYGGAEPAAEPSAKDALQAQLDKEEAGRYRVLTEVEAADLRGQQDKAVANQFSPALPREQYERMFRSMNKGATDEAIAQVMAAYDAQHKATTEAKGNAVQQRFADLQSPDALFQQRLNAKLQAKSAGGVVPKLPAAGTVTPKDLAIIDPGAANRETGFDAAANFLGHSTKAGLYDLAGAGARVLDAVNPFTISESDAATLFKDSPAKLKDWQDNSVAMTLSRFANRMAQNSDESMAQISARAKRDYGNLEYATLDPEKAAYLSPTKVIGDTVRSLPTTVVTALSVYFTRGAAAAAERQALAQGLGQEAAREAAIAAGARAMSTVGAGSEGLVGYGQQVNQATQELAKLPQAELDKSPQYQALLRSGYTPETARAQLIADTAHQAGVLAGIADAAVNKVGGEFLGKILTEGGKLVPRIMKGAANEALTETTQSALEQLGQNFAQQQNINPNQNLGQGVGEAAAAGAVLGGVMGGVAAGAGGKGPASPQEEVANAIEDNAANVQWAQPADAVARERLAPDNAQVAAASAVAPGQVMELPVQTPSTAAGPLTRATEDAAAAPQNRVTATAPSGEQVTGQLAAYQEDADGNFTAQLVDDNGQTVLLDSRQGVSVAPAEAPDAGPLTAALSSTAQAAATEPSAAPGMPGATAGGAQPAPVAATEAAPAVAERAPSMEEQLASMDLPALQERLDYIKAQAQRSGGMTKPFVEARNAVQRAIKQRKQEMANATVPTENAVERPAGDRVAAQPGAAEPGQPSALPGLDAQSAQLPAAAGTEPGAGPVPAGAGAAADAQPALTGYPTDLAARQARKELGLGKSHQIIERAPGQFDLVPQAAKVAKSKAEAKPAPRRSADKIAAAEAKAAKQEAAIAAAQANIAARAEQVSTAVPPQGAANASTQESTARQTSAQAGQAPAEANVLTGGANGTQEISQQGGVQPKRARRSEGRSTGEAGGGDRVQRQARGAKEQAQPQPVKREPRRKAKEPALSVAGEDAAAIVQRVLADKQDGTVNVPGLGDVTIPYGDAKSGLAHIARRRGEAFIPRVADLLQHGKLFTKDGQDGRVFLGHGADEAVISLTRDGEGGPWLLSAYEKYPDLHEAKRSEVAEARMPEGQYFTKEALQDNLTGQGVLGQVIRAMVDKGVIVLHGGPNKLPGGVGRRVKGVQAVTMPDGSIHMVASNLTPQTALPVLLHEMFHQGGEKLIGTKEWGNLMGRLGSLYRQADASKGNARQFFDRARARVEAARRKGAVSRAMEVEEFAAYAIEEYEKDPRSLPAAIRKWVEDLIGMVKTWLVQRFGKQLGAVTPAQLAAMSRLALLDVAAQRRGDMFGRLGEMFSFLDDSYRDEHRAPGREDGAPLSDLTGDGNIYPDDVYSPQGPRYYGTGVSYDREAFQIANRLRGKPDAEVTIYRAVPSGIDAEINSGDWVAITKQYAIDHGESRFDGDYKILSKKVRAGDIFTNGDSIQEWGYDPEDGGVRYSVSAEEMDANAPAIEAEQAGLVPPEPGNLRKLQAAVQDNMNRVKQVQERIGQTTGNTDLGGADYYGAETIRPGRIASRLEDFRETKLAPLVQDLAKAGYKPEQLEELLHAQHAAERNAANAKVNPKVDPASEEYEGTQGSGMNDADASKVLAKYAGDTKLQDLAKRARAIARATLDMKRDYGMMKPQDYELLTQRYENYVPLKGDAEYGPQVKRSAGHATRDEHILENIARDYEQAVVVGEKNRARMALLQMALKYPGPGLWTVGVPPKGRYIAGRVFSVQKDGKSEAVFTSLPQVEAFLEAKGAGASQYTVMDSAGEQVKEFTKPLQDNEVRVYINGDPVRIQIHDEALAAQVRPLDAGKMNLILEVMRGINRWLSKVYTGYNPAFIFKNAVRDAMTGTLNMTGNQGAGVAAKAWTHYPNALQTMGRWAATKKAPDSTMGRWLAEYRDQGGKTGASYMSDLEEQGKTIQQTFDDARGLAATAKDAGAKRAAGVAWRKSVGKLAHVIEVGNQATENALRLALYATLREQGVSPSKAAQAAKTVTVDFDRRGSQTSSLGALYLFLNPAIQGTANAFKTLAKGEHKAQAWGALGGLAALGALAAGKGMDDDKDRWLGQSWDERTKNVTFHFGNHQLKLPLSQEFAPFFAAGVAGAEALRGEDAGKSTAHLLSSFIDAYFPLKGAFNADSNNRLADTAQSITPTLVRPLVETGFNRNSFGSQIVPENAQTKDRADNQKMFRGTKGTVYDSVAQAIAAAGPGGKYENNLAKVSPETLKYLWRTYTGGLGSFITDSVGAARIAATSPGDLELADVPVVKDFVRAQSGRPIANRYRELAQEAQAAATEFQQIRKAGDADAAQEFGAQLDKVRLAGMGKLIQKVNQAAGALADRKVDINADTKLTLAEKRAQLKVIEQEEEALYRSALKAFTQ